MFDSCSAYHNPVRKEILFISHCVPHPPDKGEKIRAHQELMALTSRYRVHLACLARSQDEARSAYELRDRCASVHVERLRHTPALARAATRFALGGCLTASYYTNRRLLDHVNSVARRGIAAAVIYSSAMAPYAPADIPIILDYVDVDSEKWFDYARSRSRVFGVEARRIRNLERRAAANAQATFLCTDRELDLFRGFAPSAKAYSMENGVDFRYFDPQKGTEPPEIAGERFVAFIGSMNYYPNEQAACWFADHVFPRIRNEYPGVNFIVVGREPGRRVRALAGRAGVSVTGAVRDVRPYLAGALAVVAPLRIARGIQNKVLEALAMGKCVLGSGAVCESFGADLPNGVIRCESVEDYTVALTRCAGGSTPPGADIRAAAQRRFVWDHNLASLLKAVANATGEQDTIARTA